jgi:hypothetical protein
MSFALLTFIFIFLRQGIKVLFGLTVMSYTACLTDAERCWHGFTHSTYTHTIHTRRHARVLIYTVQFGLQLLSLLGKNLVMENLVEPLSGFTTGSLYRCKPMLQDTESWGRHIIHTNDFLCTVDFIFFSNQQSTIYMVRLSRDSFF